MRSRLSAVLVACTAMLAPAWSGAATTPPDNPPSPVATTPVVARGAAGELVAYDGVVEAVRQTVLAAQVAGAVVALPVRAGEPVRAGQVLARIDARAAEQTARASAAQVRAARAAQDVAGREFERQKQLFDKNYISRAALERAEAQYKAAQAEAAAQLASAGAARAQSDVHVVRAPYAGIVADVDVVLGDMAMPGRKLLTVYDPAALRVTAAIPQTVAARLARDAQAQAEVAGTGARLTPIRMQLLPTVDPASHTQELRLELPPGASATPGMFARAWLPVGDAGDARLYVPARSVLRRAELTAVYVVAEDGRPLLRQVRLGRADGDSIEILSGVAAGERVALDPQAAARVR